LTSVAGMNSILRQSDTAHAEQHREIAATEMSMRMGEAF